MGAGQETPEDQAKAALTELFEEIRNDKTPIIVERTVNEVDEIVGKSSVRWLAGDDRRRTSC